MYPASSSASSLQPQMSALQSGTDHRENPIPAVDNNNKKAEKKKLFKNAAASVSFSSSSDSTSSGFSVKGARRMAYRRRGPKVAVNAARRNPSSDEIGFRLGMSMAVLFNQILEMKDELRGRMSSDRLAKICAFTVRESLSNDFGNTFDCTLQNFEQSFGSTLRTLKSIKDASDDLSSKQIMEEEDDCLRREACTSSSSTEDYHSKEVTQTIATEGRLNYRDHLNQSILTKPVNMEVALKMWELGLKEEQVALGYDSNQLKRTKIAMGISKASFRAEKFKTQLEDTRHSELLRKCIDYLAAGLLVMVVALSYGTYVFSYRRIMEATASCTTSKDSNSWWNPLASLNSGFQVLWCQAEVVSRMAFGFFMIFVIVFMILHRSAGSKQIMPVTFIFLLLGIACGWAGKFCVDTLGGSGFLWLIFWEILCLVHFFCNVCTSVLFHILHGPVDVFPGTKGNSHWIRRVTRVVFYGTIILLPVLCGLLPFASLGEWKNHFLLLFTDVDNWTPT